MICKRDKSVSAIRYRIGFNKDKNVYTDFKPIYWVKKENSSGFVELYNGNRIECDLICYAESNSVSRLIDYDTAVYINEMPTDLVSDGDYSITYIGEANRGIIPFYLKKKPIQKASLFFAYNDEVVRFQCNFDKKQLIAYIPKNKLVPFEYGDYLWINNPTDINDTNGRIIYETSYNMGYDNSSCKFIKMVFKNDNNI